ncbi:MAG: hypothetical protein IJF39_03840 [Clostridia bacterium]|nr:hypothetical protein [Clostridia bacterium]
MKSRKSKTTSKPKRAASKPTSRSSAPKSKSKTSESKPKSAPVQAKRQTKKLPKQSTAKKEFKPKNEFRYNTKSKHKEFIFGEVGEKYKAVGITHSPKTFEKKNMPLKVNPQKGKTEQAYVRNGIVSAPKKNYGKRILKNHQFSTEDYPNVKAKIRNYKKREKRRNPKK